MIRKQSFEISFDGFPDPGGLQDLIRDTCYEQIAPAIEKILDEISEGKYRITIDRLEIDCGELDESRWQNQLIEQVARELRKDLITRPRREMREPGFDELLSFLRSGRLPWYYSGDDLQRMQESIHPELLPTDIARLKTLLASSTEAVKRLIYQFPESVCDTVIDILGRGGSEAIRRLASTTAKMEGRKKSAAQKMLLDLVLRDRPDPEKESFDGLPEEPEPKRIPAKSESRNSPVPTEPVYISNAGLIILHPFLPELFRRIGLCERKEWKDDLSRNRAIHILQFLATGRENYSEPEMILNKLLCGLEVSAALELPDPITDREKTECTELLSEVIRHWSKLKNTSIETLRHSFLERSAKLTAAENGWIMVVEQKGIDILLNSLPWGIGTIRLPWIDKTIHVEWVS